MGLIFPSVIYELALVLLLCFLWLYKKYTSPHSYWKDLGLPYVEPPPLFQIINGLFFKKFDIFKAHNDAYSKMDGGKFIGFFDLNIPSLIVKDPDLIERFLVKDFVHFSDRGFPTNPEKDPLSQNLSGLTGAKWRHLRYKLTPTFTTGKLKGMFEQICNCGENLIKDIETESKIEIAVNPKKIINNFSLDVIASCAFGIKLDQDQAKRDKFAKMVSVLVRPGLRQMVSFILLMSMPSIAKLISLKSVSQELEDFLMKLVTDTIQYRKDNKVNRNDFLQLMYNLQQQELSGVEGVSDEQVEEDDVINQMKHAAVEKEHSVEKEKVFTDACIAAQAFVFLLAGLESISSTIGHVLYCLAKNSEVQQKLHNEIDSVLGQFQHEWSYKAVKEMTYLDQVIQETLRMYPIAPELQRECTEPYALPGTNATLDKGIKLIIPVMKIHNDPENYESPEKFIPERFVDNNFKPSGTYLPFGNGPRICIAMRFAVLEVKVCIARIMSEYTVTLNDKMQVPLQHELESFMLSPVGGFWFEFNKRR